MDHPVSDQEQPFHRQLRQMKELPSTPPEDTDPSKHYAIVVDAGSSGSRVYIYWYSVPTARMGEESRLPVIDFVKDRSNNAASMKVSPGVSSFHSNLSGLDHYIRKLLDFADMYVPVEKRSSTTLHILETV